MEIRFKKTSDKAVIPSKNHESDTGLDVTAIEDKVIPARGSAVVDVGLQFSYIAHGYWVKVESRSGLGFKHGVTAHPGIIDNGYRGDAGIKLINNTDKAYQVSSGDRIAQFVVYTNHNVDCVEGEPTNTKRGSKGFGSSGN
tara:strand:+ start:1706 stop:2128 length:423 start_codon:yes stop_codon:yes gene_type:complete